MLDVQQDLKEVPFRSANNEPLNQDRKVPVCLHDMTADRSLLHGVDNPSLSIHFQDLYDFFNEVEKWQKMVQRSLEAGEKPLKDGLPIMLAEPPSSSPEDELASADEKIFAKQEETQKNKAKKSDRSVSHHIGKEIKGHPNVLTRSALKKRAAPPDTGTDLDVTKRRPGSKRHRG